MFKIEFFMRFNICGPEMDEFKVDIWKTVKISGFSHKTWLQICALFFKEEMMRNASCFVILFLVNGQLHIPKMQVSQTLDLYTRASLT